MSDFSSNGGGSTVPDELVAAGADAPLAALLHWSVASLAHGREGLEGVREYMLAAQNNVMRA